MTCKHQLWEGRRSQNSQRKKKVRESSIGAGDVEEKRVTCYKSWVTHDHESVNHPLAACRGIVPHKWPRRKQNLDKKRPKIYYGPFCSANCSIVKLEIDPSCHEDKKYVLRLLTQITPVSLIILHCR